MPLQCDATYDGVFLLRCVNRQIASRRRVNVNREAQWRLLMAHDLLSRLTRGGKAESKGSHADKTIRLAKARVERSVVATKSTRVQITLEGDNTKGGCEMSSQLSGG
jgi:hypothetical protein